MTRKPPRSHAHPLAALILSATEDEQLERIRSASVETLQWLALDVGLVCVCKFGPKGRPCTHTPETTYSLRVQAEVLRRLHADYCEPPADDQASEAVSYDACYALRIDRARRGRALFHPGDAQQTDYQRLADAFGLLMETTRAGYIVELGIARLGDLPGLDGEDCSDDDDNYEPESMMAIQQRGCSLGYLTKFYLEDDEGDD